jgi:hypothetical protein
MTELKPRKTLFNPELKRRGIYVLPNLFTTAALFAGFFAIVQAMQGDFERAAMAIFHCHGARWAGWPGGAHDQYPVSLRCGI